MKTVNLDLGEVQRLDLLYIHLRQSAAFLMRLGATEEVRQLEQMRQRLQLQFEPQRARFFTRKTLVNP